MIHLIQTIYDSLVRPHLPRKLAVCSIDDEFGGVVTRRVKLLDKTDVWEDYENNFLLSIRDCVDEGDSVLEIGGGFGVATVTAARHAGEKGHVHSLEASNEHVEYINEAAWLNGVKEGITVENAVVGPANDVWGAHKNANQYDASELSEVMDPDVLLLDCEGAEEVIVGDLSVSPRICIVEVHPHLFTEAKKPVEYICNKLTSEGYSIIQKLEEDEKDHLVHIIVGRRTVTQYKS